MKSPLENIRAILGVVRELEAGQPQCLQDMKYMVHLFAGMWGVLHCGLQRAGVVPPVEGFDYLEFARYVFSHTLKAL